MIVMFLLGALTFVMLLLLIEAADIL